MAKVFNLQTSFNSGVLDTRLSARVDTKQYYQGMSVGDNVLCLPQGGVRRRPGMEFIVDAGGFARVIPFVFNVDQAYLLVFKSGVLTVYQNDAFVTNVITPYLTEADIRALRVAQSADTMVIVNENFAPRRLIRVSASVWTLTTIPFAFVPQFDFDDASSPTPTSEIQDLTFPSALNGNKYKLTLGGVDTDDIAYENTDTATTEANLLRGLQAHPLLASADVAVAHQAGTTYRVTLSGSNADAWELFTGRSTTGSPQIVTSVRFQVGVPRKEDVWSATRGWPKSVTFHESRLWFGGSTSRPITLWGSWVNDFFNFDIANSRDDQALDVTIDADQYNEISSVFSGRHLQIFTSGDEYYIPESPITPSNIAILKQSGFGSADIQPQTIDGATIYIQRTGKALREFVFDFAEEAYISQTASLLAPEVLNSPVDLATSVGTDVEDANYIYVVNSDGTMAIFNTLRSQNVAGWSRWITDGEIQTICRLVDNIYCTVKRNINGSDEYYVEKLNDDAYTDSGVLYTSPGTATLTGLTHLEAEDVVVRADGAVMANRTVASGQINIERNAVDSAEAGLPYNVTVTTMPIEKDIGPGYNLNGEKRVVNAMMYFQNTLGTSIEYAGNTYTIPFRNFGVGILDQPVTPFTGKKEMYLLGYSKTATVTIKQTVPAPMTLLALNLEMEFS